MLITILGVLFFVFTVLGVLTAIHAVMNTRTAQGAIAWAVSLVAIPVLVVPAYWVLGRRKFEGYTEAWQELTQQLGPKIQKVRERLEPWFVKSPVRIPNYEALTALAHWPLTGATTWNS